MVEPEKPLKKKEQIKFDEEMAQRLQEELQAELEKEERLAKQREEYANTDKWDDVQAMMDADYELATRLQAEEQEELTIKESKDKTEGSKKITRKELDEESVKRQKLEDDAEKAKLRLCLEIVPYDDKVVNFEPLATKSPIVDWKTQIKGEEIYYQIERADGSYKMYKIFSEMLNDFDRQDLLDMYRLVTERFKTTRPKGSDRLLWGDLMTIFELSKEDELWRNQQD
ncbi:hypothetical protein Tco_0540584 [Tanacetum coccineum]